MSSAQNILVDQGPLLHAAGLVHRVSEPQNPGPHPTVIMLHGRFGNEEVMWVFERAVPRQWLKMAPRAIQADPGGGFSWLLRDDDVWPQLEAFDSAVQATVDFISTLPSLYNADPDRLFLMGFSQGAALAYAIALAHPGLVRGVAGLVGFFPESAQQPTDMAGLKGLPIFAAVGRKDKLVPYERALRSIEQLQAAEAQLEFREYDTGHKLNAQGLRDLTEWWSSSAE